MIDSEEYEMYQTDMERILSHNVMWWQEQCRKMELDYKRRIENREDRNERLDKALDIIKALLASKTVEINTGQVWLDEICIDLREKLKAKEDNREE